MMAGMSKQHAPSTERNRDPILTVLREHLPAAGSVLEIASGSGQHAVHFAAAFPGLLWQPTDPNPDALASIRAWAEEAALPNLLPPLRLDVTEEPWPVGRADVVVCINMVHISPWTSTEALMRGAGRVLGRGGLLYLYGPYKVGGLHAGGGDIQFDAWLKERDARFGIRDVEAVIAEAEKYGLIFAQRIKMPADNHSLLFYKG